MVVSAMLLAACAGDSTSPSAARFEPVDASKALVGVIDGVYTFTINPSKDQSIKLGASSLDLPASSVCRLLTTSYGPTKWNDSCVPESLPVTITAVVKNAATNHPSIEFAPAMRFNPATTVQLHLFVTNAETLGNMTVMKYCGPFSAVCVDESLTDSSLQTAVNAQAGLVSRRIKHFSGYVVAENGDNPMPGGQ
ncbi:MAG: hypothetical protein ABI664_12855 [bacterium]